MSAKLYYDHLMVGGISLEYVYHLHHMIIPFMALLR